MTCLFVHIRCRPGTTYEVAEEIGLREIHSELYSISGDYDLLLKIYIPEGEDIGRYINDNLLNIDGIERTSSTERGQCSVADGRKSSYHFRWKRFPPRFLKATNVRSLWSSV